MKKIRDFSFPKAEKLLVFDARPKINAQANLAKGGGYEKPEFYKLSDEEINGSNSNFLAILFCDIGNIHVMRDSLRKVEYALQKNKGDKWLHDLDESQWLQHIRWVKYHVTKS